MLCFNSYPEHFTIYYRPWAHEHAQHAQDAQHAQRHLTTISGISMNYVAYITDNKQQPNYWFLNIFEIIYNRNKEYTTRKKSRKLFLLIKNTRGSSKLTRDFRAHLDLYISIMRYMFWQFNKNVDPKRFPRTIWIPKM